MATPHDPVATAPGSELADPLNWIWRTKSRISEGSELALWRIATAPSSDFVCGSAPEPSQSLLCKV